MTTQVDTPYAINISADEDITWMKKGLCVYADPKIFFPKYDAPSTTEAPKAICNRCPVRGECLEWALNHDEEGVWGGTNEADRRALKRRKSRTSCLVCESEDIFVTEGMEVCLACGVSWRC